MKQKLLSLLLLLCALIAGSGSAWATDVTYTFTSKAWASASGNWSGSSDGSALDAKGVQCLKDNTYTVTSPSSLSNISSIVVTYGTAKNTTTSSKISIKVGSNSAVEKNVAGKSLTDATLTWDFDPAQTGSIEMAVTAAGASVYIKSVKVTYSSGGSSAAATTTTIDDSGITNTDLKDGTAAGSLSASVTLTSGGTAVPNATVTWSGDNDAVATINASTGVVTLVDEGTVKFTASYAGVTDTYAASTSSKYEMTVTDSRYETSTLTFTAAYGSGPGIADDDVEWTVTSDGTESNFDNTSGIHYGTNSAEVQYVQLSTSGINGIIKKVKVNTRDAQASGSVTVTVGGSSFNYGENTSVTATNTSTEYTFTGSGKGQIIVRVDRGSANTKAIYVKSVKVYYEPSTDPAISANDVELIYDATSGSIDYSLANATGNVSAVVTTGSDWLTLGTITSSAVPFTCSANTGAERTAAVTLSFTGAEDKVVTITQAAAPAPTITSTPASLTGFTYEYEDGPSATKTISVSGTNLTADITLSLGNNSDFEMSTTEGSGYTNSLTLTQSNGTVAATTVYVRLKADLAVGNSYSGTITLTSTGATDATVSLSGSVTVPVVDYATLPFSWTGGGKSDLTALNGVTANGLGGDYAAGNAPYLVKLDGTGDYIDIKTNEKPNKVYIGVKMIGGGSTSKITVQASEDGSSFDEGEGLTISGSQNDIKHLVSTRTFDSSVRYIRLLFTKGSNIGVGAISIIAGNSVPATVNASGYGTFASGFPLDFSSVSNVSAWQITSANSSTGVITFSQITGAVASATGVLLKREADGDIVIPVSTTSGTELETNLLKGNTADTHFAEDSFYGLSGNQLYLNEECTLPAGKAYLPASEVSSNVKSFTFVFNDDETGISEIRTVSREEASKIFDLAGRRLAKPVKGINIVNGKKVLVK